MCPKSMLQQYRLVSLIDYVNFVLTTCIYERLQISDASFEQKSCKISISKNKALF